MEWPHSKTLWGDPHWNTNFHEFAALLDSVRGEHWWITDTALKYLTLRIDTRNNNFLCLIDGRGEGGKKQIDPQRVADAIAEYNEKYASHPHTDKPERK